MRLLTSLVLSAASLMSATVARADSLKDMIGKLPAPTLVSDKTSDALEFCIGSTIGDWLTPITMRGEKKVLIYGSPIVSFSNAIYILVEVREEGGQRSVTYHAHKAWNDKTAALIRSCL